MPAALVPMKLSETLTGPDPESRMPTGSLPEIRLQEPVQGPNGVVPLVPPMTAWTEAFWR